MATDVTRRDRAWPTLLARPGDLVRGDLACGEIEIGGEAYRHLFRARRLAAGDPLRVVDGAGRAVRGEVAAVDRKTATIRLHDELPSREPAVDVELLVGALRPERASWLVEKATELGVRAVRFVSTTRTPRVLRPERLERVARAAVEQCGRARLPALGVHGWDEIESLIAGREPADSYVLDPDAPADPSIERPVDRPRPDRRTILCVGPEGGFDASELETLRGLGCRPLGLGPRILRVETAAIAAATLVLLAGETLVLLAGDRLRTP